MRNLACRTTSLTLLAAVSGGAVAGAATPIPPAASTGGVANVTFQGAVLTGAVNPRGVTTSYSFQYGPSKAYGAQTTVATAGAGTSNVPVATGVGGLAPATIYHYRLVAASNSGTTVGADRSFKTAKLPLSLAIVAVPSTTTFGDPAMIEGTLSGTGNGNREVVLQANPFPYTAGFQNVGNPELTTANGSFAFAILPVTLNTQYRVVGISTPTVVSPVVFEYAALRVSARVSRHRLHRGARLRFSGSISPSQVGAQVGLQRLTGRGWQLVAGTIARPNTATSSTYALTVRVTHGAFFRVIVVPANQGAYVTGYSTGTLVHLRG